MSQQLHAKLRIIDEVWCIFVGLQDRHIDALYEQFGVLAPNYFFHPLVKLGRWDGKIRFFQTTGKTYLYLLDEILPYLSRAGYKLTIEDLRTQPLIEPSFIDKNVFAHVNHPDTGEPIILRDYQVDAVNSLLPHGNGTVIAATAAGKTFITAAMTYAYGLIDKRVITIVPNQDLVRNTKRDYATCGLDVGEYSGKEKSIERTHVVSTWQALRVNPKIVSLFDVVIVDETHLSKGATIQKLLSDNGCNISCRFGVTGTLPKEKADRMAVLSVTGPVRYTIEASTLIAAGVLAQPHVDVFVLEENLQQEYSEYCKETIDRKQLTYVQFKDKYFPDFAAEKSSLHYSTRRIEWIAALLEHKRDGKKGNTLCLVDGIAFGRKLAALIPDAVFINGQDVKKQKDRQEIYDLFKDHDNVLCIATFQIAGTGTNIPRIFNLVTVDIGKSFVKIIQGIGRSLRTAHDKDSVSITDVCSDLKYGKKHLTQRINYYKEAKYPFKKYKIDYTKDTLSVDNNK